MYIVFGTKKGGNCVLLVFYISLFNFIHFCCNNEAIDSGWTLFINVEYEPQGKFVFEMFHILTIV